MTQNRNKSKLILILPAILAFIVCVYILLTMVLSEENTTENKLRVHYLDVGQGDSIFIEFPDDKTMLIDAADKGVGEGITDYITQTGHTSIDYLVATHPHADHIGSMQYVVEHMDIGAVYMPRAETNTKTFEGLLKAIKNKGLKIKTAKNGVNVIDEENLSMNILAPSQIDDSNLNNNSVVMKLSYYDCDFLFTGDAEMGELNTIEGDVSADVLKVGHHGSSTSTTKEFLERVNPSIAVISCGKGNDYGHPHKQTLNLLKKKNIEVHRTDKEHTIVIETDGNTLDVTTAEGVK